MLLLLLTILLSAAAFAQPQAPIEWGEARWIGLGATEGITGVQYIIPSGDTLLFIDVSVQGDYRPATAYSFDNGMTYSSWQLHADPGDQTYGISAALEGNRVFLLWSERFDHAMRQQSLDGGMTWLPAQQFAVAVPISVLALNLTVVAVELGEIGEALGVKVRWSFNGGDSWGSEQLIDTVSDWSSKGDVSLTRNFALVGGSENTGDPTTRIYVARGSRAGTPWTGFETLPDQPYAVVLRSLSIASDTTSDNAVMLSTWDYGAFSDCDAFFTRTSDGGETWEPRQQMTVGRPVSSWDNPQIFCRGKLYGAALMEAPAGHHDAWGIYFRLSANHGRSWYPQQRIDTEFRQISYTIGQFVGDEVRVYYKGVTDSTWTQEDYRTVTGILHPDSVFPDLAIQSLPPDTVTVGDTVRFEFIAADEDTLFGVRVLWENGGEIQNASIEEISDDQYVGSFVIEAEGRFRYRIEAEDWWENVSSYPDTGWATFVTDGWIDVADDIILHPSSFRLSVFPNPTNGSPRLELSPEWFTHGFVSIAVYNILGEQVWQSNLARYRDLISIPPLPTGVYFLNARSRTHTASHKFLILR